MNDLLTGEPLLAPGAAQRLFFDLSGFKPSRSAFWRWLLDGRLESRRIGSRLFTTERAIRAMLAADETRNHGSTNARGLAAAKRVEAIPSTRRHTKRKNEGRR